MLLFLFGTLRVNGTAARGSCSRLDSETLTLPCQKTKHFQLTWAEGSRGAYSIVISRPSYVVRHLSTISKVFSSETTGLILTKFHMQPLGPLGKKTCSNGLGHMTKMATMPIYGKNLKKSSSPEPTG